MKQVVHKIMAFLMATVVLFSTLSFTIDMHYCGDTLVDAAIFHEAKTCGMEMQKEMATSEHSITKKNCCDDEQLFVNGQHELQSAAELISFQQQVFITSFLYSYVALFETTKNTNPSYKHYKPPPVVRELYKIDETYLI